MPNSVITVLSISLRRRVGYHSFCKAPIHKKQIRKDDENEQRYIYKESDGYTDVPLIALFEGHRFRSFCGEEYLALLRKEKKNTHWAFIFVSHKEYSYYLNNFGKQFQTEY